MSGDGRRRSNIFFVILLGGMNFYACVSNSKPNLKNSLQNQTNAVSGGTATFQNGVQNYTSTRTVSISNENSQYDPNGVTTFSGETMLWKLSGSGGYEERSLIRFDALNLPSGAVVSQASLLLTFDNWSSTPNISGYYFKQNWNPNVGSGLGWLHPSTGVNWQTPGAGGAGSDYFTSPTFSITDLQGTGDEVRSITLDPQMVQQWVNHPAANLGVLLVNNDTDKDVRIHASDDSTLAKRPLLSISYAVANSNCSTVAQAQGFVNSSFAPQSGPFTAEFDATPSAANMDGIMGLAQGTAQAFASIAVIPRFNTQNVIDARNYNVYQASTPPISYVANSKYHFRLVVDTPNKKYSAFVTAPQGSEQVLANNIRFRKEEADLTTAITLDHLVLEVDSTQGSLQVCNFKITSQDVTPPTVAVTAPQNGATVTGTITLSATASDNVAVAGVQFLADGVNIGSEITQAPYTIQFNTVALTNGSHTLTARARDAANNTANANVTVTVSNTVTTGNSHPRIFLTNTVLAALGQKAQAQAAQWTRLRSACESYVGQSIGPGYQGEDYMEPLLNLGLCYRVGQTIHDSRFTAWGHQGVAILHDMALFTAYGTDSGYGIRNYGIGMAMGYDWFYEELIAESTASENKLANLYNSLNAWLAFYDQNGFGRGQSQSNYFAGYYATKAYAAIATQGENTNADALWNDFLNRLHRGGATALSGPEGTHAGVQLFYSQHMTGGGWSEGPEYGPQAMRNMSLPSLAVLTAKNIDLINDTNAPYGYPLDNAMNYIQLAWPSRTVMDDRDAIHASSSGYDASVNVDTFTVIAGLLQKWNHPLFAQYHAYAREVRNINGLPRAWIDFLFWDDGASEQSYLSLPMSFFARGMNTVSMRSDWSQTAIWGSLRASSYIDNPYSGEQAPDAGSPAIITRGNVPFLANQNLLVMNLPGFSDAVNNAGENALYADTWQNGPRIMHNTFWYDSGQILPECDNTPPPRTSITRFEDDSTFVFTRAENLQDVYSGGTKNWTRDMLYVRPELFVFYDRTLVDLSTQGDERFHWHVMNTPQAVTSASGTNRFDVSDTTFGYVGTLTTVYPTSAKINVVDDASLGKMFRIEVRPPSQTASTRWLTVLDAAIGANSAAVAGPLNMTSSNALGTLMQTSSGNIAVLFGINDVASGPISGNISFALPTVATRVFIVDLTPNSHYSVTTTQAGGSVSVTLSAAANGTIVTTAAGAASFNVP